MFLAWRELQRAKLRYTLIGAIMMLIAWLIFMVTGLANGLAADNASAVQSMDAKAFVLDEQAEQKLSRSVLGPEVLAQLQEQIGADNATPLSQQMLSVEKGTKKLEVTVLGIDPNSFLAPVIKQGRGMETDGEVVVSAALAEQGVQLGDELKSEDPQQTLTVVGFTDKAMLSHTPVVYAKVKPGAYQAIALQAESTDVSGGQMLTKQELVQTIPGYKEEQGSLTMMTVFLVVIAAFVQAGFFYVLTLQKTSQFGVLKAIGTTTAYLAKSVIGQVLLLAVTAIVTGLGFTFGVSALLPAGMPFVLSSTTIGQYIAILLGVSVLGASLSLFQIARIDAIEAIGRAEA